MIFLQLSIKTNPDETSSCGSPVSINCISKASNNRAALQNMENWILRGRNEFPSHSINRDIDRIASSFEPQGSADVVVTSGRGCISPRSWKMKKNLQQEPIIIRWTWALPGVDIRGCTVGIVCMRGYTCCGYIGIGTVVDIQLIGPSCYSLNKA